MRRIICDTQIWYYLAKGNVIKPKGYEIIGTFLSIEELALTKNQDRDLNTIRNVIRTAMTSSNGFLELPPFQYLASYENPNIKISDYPNNEGFMLYTQMIANNNETEDIFNQIGPYRDHRKQLYSGLASDINVLVKQVKNTTIAKKDYWNFNTISDNRKLINQWVNLTTGVNLSEDFDWNQIELFEKVMDFWFKELALNKTLWIKPNDLIDFFNLIYVGPEDLYWCKDKVWNRRIQNSGIDNYLFEKL